MTSRPNVAIHIGQIHVAKEPTVIKTVVGSCIAVCLYDPALRLGGMNHFLLPTPCNGDRPADLARFGIHAMELLIGAMQKSGGDRRRLQAKVFGGGHVLAFSAQTDSVPAQNIRFIQQFPGDRTPSRARLGSGGISAAARPFLHGHRGGVREATRTPHHPPDVHGGNHASLHPAADASFRRRDPVSA